jgi:hypothetical protein
MQAGKSRGGMSDYKQTRSVLRAAFILVGLLFLSQGARADTPYSFIRIQCMGAINRLEVSTFITWNVCDTGCSQAAPLARQGIYELRKFIQQYSKHPFECDLGAGQTAVVSILDHWPGRALPGMEFDISINGRRVVPPQRLDGEDELDLQVQAFLGDNDAAGRPINPASVSSNLCFLDGRNPLALPGSMRCMRTWVGSGEGWTNDQADSAQYERIVHPN